MSRSTWLFLGGTLLGLGIALWTLDRVGLQPTFAALAQIGFGGLALFLLA
jgi:hypothetical protein